MDAKMRQIKVVLGHRSQIGNDLLFTVKKAFTHSNQIVMYQANKPITYTRN